jgi:hypothetical protein
MNPILDKEIYKFYNRNNDPTIWVEVEIYRNYNFIIKSNFRLENTIDKYSIKDYADYLNLQRLAFDFGNEKCRKELS